MRSDFQDRLPAFTYEIDPQNVGARSHTLTLAHTSKSYDRVLTSLVMTHTRRNILGRVRT